MDKLINLDQNGGFPLKSDDLRLLFGTDEFDAGVYNAFNSLLSAFGDNYIVSGCEYNSGTGLIAEGFVFLGGELLKVDEHPKTGDYFLKVTSEQTARTFKNGSNYNVHRENRAKAISSGGVLKYNGETLKDITIGPYLDSSLNKVDKTIKKSVFEIGPWDMDTDGSLILSTGDIPFSSIVMIGGVITNDAQTSIFPFPNGSPSEDPNISLLIQEANTDSFTGNNVIVLVRLSGTFFDSSLYSDDTINRGYLVVEYVV